MQKVIAISACLMGKACRYDGIDNKNNELLTKLQEHELIPFCPEDASFGTPRPTMDLIQTSKGNRAISNLTGEDLSTPIIQYANNFFKSHRNIDLYIGKDRSPSCGVCSAKVYDKDKKLHSSNNAGLMTQEAQKYNILCIDAEKF